MPEEGGGAAPTVVQVEEGEKDHHGDAAPGHQAKGAPGPISSISFFTISLLYQTIIYHRDYYQNLFLKSNQPTLTKYKKIFQVLMQNIYV